MPRPPKDGNAKNPQGVQRNPKCSRCRNHGFVVRMKGHSGGCPFVLCECWKCSLITQRTSIMASHRRLKRACGEPDCCMGGPGQARSRPASGGSDVVDGPAVSSSSAVGTRIVTRTRPQVHGEPRRKGEGAAGKDAGRGGFEGSGIAEVEGQRWSPANPDFPVDYALTEASQREMYAGKLLIMPAPEESLSCYHFPGVLVNLPPVWPRGLQDPLLGFPRFQPSCIPSSSGPGLSHEMLLPLFPHPGGTAPGVVQETNLRLSPGPVSQAGLQAHGSQESEVIVVDSDSSAENPL